MSGIVTKNFRLFAASQFKEMFTEPQAETLYAFIGRPNPWADDNNPPTPLDTVTNTDYDIWNNMISAKKIVSSDTTYATNRYNWTSGVVYTQYTSNTEFQSGQFFVMTDEYQIYKCMYNNRGATSTVKPTGRLTSVFTTSDGYKWKFMCEIPAGDAIKFVTTNYIPIKTLTSDDGSFQWDVQAAAVDGAISTVGVSAAGSGYKTHTGSVISANTTTITLQPTANSTNGTYTRSSVYISTGTGAGQLRQIVNYIGASKRATVSPAFSTAPTGSSTYIVSPSVTLTGDGTAFAAYSTVSNGTIRTIEVVNDGHDYTRGSASITANGTTGGTGATLIPYVSPKGGHGANPVYELNGHNVMTYIQFSGSEGGSFFANNDFRVLGIVANPTLASNNAIAASGAAYLISPKFTIGSPSGTFLTDEIITGATSGATGILVEYTGSTHIIVTNVIGTFGNEVITGGSSGATATITSTANSLLEKYSGSVLYIEDRAPIVRTENQEENFRIIINL